MKKFTKLCALLGMVFTLTACGGQHINDGDVKIKVTDMAGRVVEIKKNPQRFVCVGPGALRQYSYVGDPNKLVGIETCDQTGKIGQKPYLSAIKNKDTLPIIGEGGPADLTNYEALFSVKADVVFSSYVKDLELMEEMSRKSRTPFLAIGYNSNGLFAQDIYDSIKFIAKICGNEQRGIDVVNYFETSKAELASLAKPATTQNGYLGCVNFRGKHGINFTTGEFPVFDILNIKNCINDEGINNFAEVDKGVIFKMQPDKIIIDAGGLSLLKEDMKNDPGFFKTIDAFKNKEVYLIMPTVFYSCNFDVALANAYFIGKVFYPTQFANVNMEAKFNEITQFLYHTDCYSEVCQTFNVTYGKLPDNF